MTTTPEAGRVGWVHRVPLRIQLVVALVVLTALGLATAGAAATTALDHYMVQRIDEQLADFAKHQPPGDRGGDGDADGYRRPRDFFGAAYVATYDASGDVAWPAGLGEPVSSLPAIPASRLSGATNVTTFDAHSPDGEQWRVLAAPAGSGGRVFVQSLAEVSRTVRRMALVELVLGVAVLLVLGALAYVVVRRSLRPLVAVERTAAAIARGDLSRRVPHRDPRTEVGRLTAALNGMLRQIESAFRVQEASEAAARASEERMRRFVADASHELRTPLTSIRGFAELYRQGAVGPEDLARLLRRIEDEATRMGLLVEDLLLLARLDEQRPLERAPVDLLELATDAVHDASVVAKDRMVRLDATGAERPPVVRGDEARLRQVLGNLVSNALTHTPAGTPVTLRVSTAGDTAVLEVADAGPGLPPDTAQRVFERFYRVDSSRTRASGGTGLGLSIVAALVAAHGGTVHVETAPGHGATFRVVLPLAESARSADTTHRHDVSARSGPPRTPSGP